jgi:hypothetical protein
LAFCIDPELSERLGLGGKTYLSQRRRETKRVCFDRIYKIMGILVRRPCHRQVNLWRVDPV